MNSPDEQAVDAVASSVGDGQPVDWADVAATVHLSGDPAVVRELQVIARIGAFHRNAPRPEIAPDQRIGQRWGHLEILALLGAGSFGTVYRARDPRLQRDVALKIYRTRELSEHRATALFSEGRLLARVRHPNVIFVHGVETHDGEVGLWLDLVDGRTLADEVKTGGPLGFREAALVGQDICRALAAVHQEGLIHRDIKPQNVMRERGGRIVLMDFGLGHDLRADPKSMEVGGTPLYMAPEVFAGRDASVASDIYSVGVLMFYLVTGSHPVFADSRARLAQSHREGQRRLLRDMRADLPDAFVEVVDRACSADPAKRYATAGALNAALAGVLGVSSNLSTESTGVRSGVTRASRWALAAAAAVLVTIGIGIAIAVRQTPRTTEPAAAAPPAISTVAATPSTSTSIDPAEYRIGATFHRAQPSGSTPLQANARVRLGDRLFLEIEATRAVHVYVVNQDEQGENYLLFPLPGQATRNPLAADRVHRLPGTVDWEVTSAGGREHFLVVASPEPLDALQKVFERLPAPRVGGPPATSAPLSNETIGQLRGIGGLSPREKPGMSKDLLQSAAQLGGAESVKGAWMRQFTLENPPR